VQTLPISSSEELETDSVVSTTKPRARSFRATVFTPALTSVKEPELLENHDLRPKVTSWRVNRSVAIHLRLTKSIRLETLISA
jgi:hypothetical protein